SSTGWTRPSPPSPPCSFCSPGSGWRWPSAGSGSTASSDRPRPGRGHVITGLMEGRVTGRVAVVSGAANGIGRASALRLAREGADLVVVDREGDTLQGVAREIEAAGRRGRADPPGPRPPDAPHSDLRA